MKCFTVTVILQFACFVQCNNVDIKKLLQQMNEEEKCGQMTQLNVEAIIKDYEFLKPDENPIDLKKLKMVLKEFKVGAMCNTVTAIALSSKTWQEMITMIQNIALNETRLKIPALYGIDSAANYIQEAVLFPQSLKLGDSIRT
jgi:beta-glucosidase